jgi:hypothetical protein
MANLVDTSLTTLSASNISSPKILNTSSHAIKEYVGSIYLTNNQSVDLFGNADTWVRLPGMCNFYGEMVSMAWTFGIFDFNISYYGLVQNVIMNSDVGAYTLAHYSESSANNYLRFTNTAGQAGTFYFSITTPGFSTILTPLTRIK